MSPEDAAGSSRPAIPERFWSIDNAELFLCLAASRDGLSDEEAARRLGEHGPNAIRETSRPHLLVKVARRLAEPLVAILIIAAAVSGATGDWASFCIILAILALSTALDVFQEHRAEAAADTLRRAVAVHADIRRRGRIATVPVEDLVPGDIVMLKAGDFVPADGIVLAASAAHVNEALLTGEPYPVEKRPGPSTAAIPAEAFNALFGGTVLVGGEVEMMVVATGASTRLGGIAAALRVEEPPTAFQRGLHALGVLILRLTSFLVLFVLLTHLALGRPVLESFLFAVALAVGLTPELLPMVVTVTLSRGALRMAGRQVIVKRLAAIHDLGAMDVLCTDKTGTLTEARIALVGHPGFDGADSEHVLELAAVNSRFESGVRSALDEAILSHAGDRFGPEWRRIASAPFDFERRRVSVLAARNEERVLIVKGAPEEILARSIAFEAADGSEVMLDEAARSRLSALLENSARQGLRALGIARRGLSPECGQLSPADERDLVFVGFCTFVDPPKASAAHAVARLEAAGIRVKIVSGDAALVVQHLVETLAIPTRGMLTGADISGMSDAELAVRARTTDLFVRVSPDQKTRIIQALRSHGHTVGFIGDGINDAPAIRAADVGLSVDGATDVARAAADIILLAHDLGVLAEGVEEGRRTDANISKYVRMGTSSNFGNMLSMAFASLVIPFLPLTPIQVLLNNLLYDISETGIPFDTADPEDLREPHGLDMKALIRFTLVMGPLSSAFDLATFGILLWGFGASPEVFRTAWFLESMGTQILVIFLIRTAAPAWASRPKSVLVATSLSALAAAVALALGPWGPNLGFAPLPGTLLAAIAGLVVAYLAAAEALKRVAVPGPRRRGAWLSTRRHRGLRFHAPRGRGGQANHQAAATPPSNNAIWPSPQSGSGTVRSWKGRPE